MKDFFKFMFSSIIGTFIALFLLFLIFVGSIAALMPKDSVTIVKDNSILKITLNNAVVDRSPNNPLENFNFQSMKPDSPLGLNDILNNIDKAKDDDKIKGIYLELSFLQSGIATTQEIRNALLSFKESGKFIISYGDYYSQSAYYLASVSDKIYLNPSGNLDYTGLRTELMFFKRTLEKLGVEPQIIRGTGNKFKSAVEPFMYDHMSEANRLQTETFLNTIWGNIKVGISNQRGIEVSQLDYLADNMIIRNAISAVDNNLIDGVKYIDEVYAELMDSCGVDKLKDLEFVTLSKYTDAPKTNRKHKGFAKEKVAVIYASGDIVMGNADVKQIGSAGISKAIRKARLDTTIKAIVLRINSPGGSALASEVILREVMLARDVKPVIASMGDVAASGGYYIACLADTIVASENTITGSIGVFGLMFNIENFLDDKLGISVDRVITNKHSDIGSSTRKMTAEEKLVIQQSVDDIYGQFIGHVANGRSMTTEAVDNIGQGRVWSGVSAMEIGLIDVFGGLDKAIEIAVEKAGLDHYRIVELPKLKDPFEQIVSELTGQASISILKKEIGVNYKYYEYIKRTVENNGIQARMPFTMEIY